MKIVVVKSPRFLKGILRFIFGIKKKICNYIELCGKYHRGMQKKIEDGGRMPFPFSICIVIY